MKKFILRLLVFCLVMAAVVLVVNENYLTIRSTNDTDKFDNVPDEIQICNFGSSHGLNDFHYERIEEEYVCFNFALSSQSLDYDYRIMQYYQDKISKDAIVFITISYFSFYGIDETLMDNFLSKNKRYYRFLPEEYIKDYDLKTYIYEVRLPALTAYENLFTSFFGKTTDFEEIETAKEKNLEKYAKAAYQRHLVTGRLDENGNRILNEEHMKSLYGMITLCKEKGAIPVLVTTPYLREYTDEVMKSAPEFLNGFYKIIDNVVSLFDIRYIDYSFDERFIDRYDLFTDVDHLNDLGALEFMDILMNDVAEIMLQNVS